jgi:hypothetical protein
MTITINGTTGIAGVDGSASTPAIKGNDTDTGIYYPSANEVAAAAGGSTVWNASSTFAFKNRIINGGMVIDQRNAGASISISSSVYTLDRWAADQSGLNAFTVQRSTTTPTGFTNSLLITTGTGATVDAGDYAVLRQAIEGYNVADLGLGTASASPFILSFWVRCSVTGTFGVSFRNSAATATYCATYTVNATNTWEFKTVAVPAITSGTWTTDNTVGIGVFWDLGVGATYSGTAGQLNTGANYFGVSGTTKLLANTGATMYITGVQLERGTVATSFDFRSFGQELALCQRYAIKYGGDAVYQLMGSGMSNGTTTAEIYTYFPVQMRTQPSVTASTLALGDGQSLFALTSLSIATDQASTKIGFLNCSVASGLTIYRPLKLIANNSLSAYVIFSAEL